MPVVVTGSAGFLGMAVLQRLHQTGLPSLGIDRRPCPPGATGIVADLLDDDPAVHDALRHADAVIHLAARAGVRDRGPGIDRARHRDTVQTVERVLGLVPLRTPVVVTSSSSVTAGHAREPARNMTGCARAAATPSPRSRWNTAAPGGRRLGAPSRSPARSR